MKYFTIEELCKSSTASRYKINNTPTEKIILNLEALVDNILDPLREYYGKPIRINSGYRCPILNTKVRGSKNSLHCLGLAADISAGNPRLNKKLFNLIQLLQLPYDLLIDEYNYSWIHVSFSSKNRRQIIHID